MNSKATGNCCRARTKTGKPCRAAATAGGLCFFHANPNKASELGRLGGRKNRHVVADAIASFPTLETAAAVRNAVSRLIADVHSGRVHPKVASSLAQLLSLQLHTIETSELERKVDNLKRQSGQTQSEESYNGNGSSPAAIDLDDHDSDTRKA